MIFIYAPQMYRCAVSAHTNSWSDSQETTPKQKHGIASKRILAESHWFESDQTEYECARIQMLTYLKDIFLYK